MKEKITQNTALAEILEKPELVEILAKYNLPCLNCPMAKFEIENLKIGEVCKMYGIDLGSLLKELNTQKKK
jgi:hybrid cluster-associated redox disulfide protein